MENRQKSNPKKWKNTNLNNPLQTKISQKQK